MTVSVHIENDYLNLTNHFYNTGYVTIKSNVHVHNKPLKSYPTDTNLLKVE